MACCSRGVRGMLMAGKCNRFLRVPELLVATWIRMFLRRVPGWVSGKFSVVANSTGTASTHSLPYDSVHNAVASAAICSAKAAANSFMLVNWLISPYSPLARSSRRDVTTAALV